MLQVPQLPANFQLLYGEQQIAEAVRGLGRQTSAWAAEVWRQSHTHILAIPILRGAIFFFADLVRQIEHSVEIAPARAWAYEKNLNPQPVIKLNLEAIPARGRAVLLVDDICDSGRTLHALKNAVLEAGALVVKSVVLVKRMSAGETFEPDWAAFKYPGAEWLVGYGMDDGDRWRNLPAIYVIKQS